MLSKGSNHLSRREFVRTAAASAAVASAWPGFLRGAEPDKRLKVGLVGCGGRGTEAALFSMQAAPGVTVTALADLFRDRISHARNALKEMATIEDRKCFVGLDACRRLIDSGVDYVILATPPYYRPEHLAACVEAGKHVFMEKPVAVDAVGVRRVIDIGEQAARKSLSLVAGTQRRHQNSYIETIRRLHDGAIGRILAAQCYWNGGQAWYKKREKGWSDVDWMHRDWNNWSWLSGGHVVEQHVHNLDVINWALGTHPERVLAMGGRHRRVTGNQYDFFSADITYPGHVHVLSQCRQIAGCKKEVCERVIGEKGVSNCNGWISGQADVPFEKNDPYVQELADLTAAIRTGQPINEARNVAEATLVAIMIRTSAYTGQEVTWDEMINSDLVLAPPDYELTEEKIRAHIPVPGKA